MTRFEKIIETAKPEMLASMLRCPAEYDRNVENCDMSGEFCRKCILQYLNGQAEPDAKKEVKHKCGSYGNVL